MHNIYRISTGTCFRKLLLREHLCIYFQCLCSSSNPTEVSGTCYLLNKLQVISISFGSSEGSLISGDQGWNELWRLNRAFTERNNSSIFDLNTNYNPTHSLFWNWLYFKAKPLFQFSQETMVHWSSLSQPLCKTSSRASYVHVGESLWLDHEFQTADRDLI